MAMQEVAKSNEDIKESINVSREDIKSVEDFKDYYDKATDQEKKKLNDEFANNIQEELSKDPSLKSQLEGETVDSEIRQEDIENINTLNKLQDNLRKYPNIPTANRQAIDKMVYGPFRDSEKNIQNILDKDENKDKKIES